MAQWVTQSVSDNVTYWAVRWQLKIGYPPFCFCFLLEIAAFSWNWKELVNTHLLKFCLKLKEITHLIKVGHLLAASTAVKCLQCDAAIENDYFRNCLPAFKHLKRGWMILMIYIAYVCKVTSLKSWMSNEDFCVKAVVQLFQLVFFQPSSQFLKEKLDNGHQRKIQVANILLFIEI